MKPAENQPQAFGMVGLDAGLRTFEKKPFQALMPKSIDHCSKCNLSSYTCQAVRFDRLSSTTIVYTVSIMGSHLASCLCSLKQLLAKLEEQFAGSAKLEGEVLNGV